MTTPIRKEQDKDNAAPMNHQHSPVLPLTPQNKMINYTTPLSVSPQIFPQDQPPPWKQSHLASPAINVTFQSLHTIQFHLLFAPPLQVAQVTGSTRGAGSPPSNMLYQKKTSKSEDNNMMRGTQNADMAYTRAPSESSTHKG